MNEARSNTITFEKGAAIEFAFAAILPGKEAQLFGEYFPKVGPIVADWGGRSLGSGSVEESVFDEGQPSMLAIFHWDSVQAYNNLHGDPRFQKVKPIRDEAMSFFSNAHFFEVGEKKSVEFKENAQYVLAIEWEKSSQVSDLADDALVFFSGVKSGEGKPFGATVFQSSPAVAEAVSNIGNKPSKSLSYFKFKFNFPSKG